MTMANFKNKCKKKIPKYESNQNEITETIQLYQKKYVQPNYVKLLIIPDEILLSFVENFIELTFNEYAYINTIEKMKIKKKCVIINILEAQKKFYESNMTENPIFNYNIPDEKVDNIYNMCNGDKIDFNLFHEARRIIQIVKEKYTTYDNYEDYIFGNDLVTKEEFKNYILKYLQDNNVENKVKVGFKENLISAIQIFKKGNQYILQLRPQNIKKKMIHFLCNHEIATHLLRMINHDNNNLIQWDINPCHVTEEGLAVINSMYSLKEKNNFLIYPALKYLAVCLGKFYNFSKLYIFLNNIIKDTDKCFRLCARAKRGLRDTSFPGSVYHDQLYFIGSYSILKWHKNIDFQLLYSGNIGLKSLRNISKYVNVKNNILPKFLSNQTELNAYLEFLEHLSCINGITPEACNFITIEKTN
ncbi:conserved protein, unknown function [Plasmodium vinckei vinckei]|uniref:DUF1704 domain-containing protein n=1 Tax=Plasmodium vinckei vinckei TaxID=54757 RepID=A0A449BS73_PLAVN|nr:conserved protein, unknown function [Plasmodium vinckei vinckei]KEG02064.1 hypothetical protein YYE_02803 [Plasmodium vinckei vinckei]VEV56304.1 conserved protein, unknown function [Plasmodium vinckei vinckei]